MDHVRAVAVRDAEEADGEQDLGDLQRQEDERDRDVHPRRPEEHVRVEDREGEQEPGERVVEVRAFEQAAEAFDVTASTTKVPSASQKPP